MEKYKWLNKHSRLFLDRGYLEKGTSPEQRIRQIAETAEQILKKPGFADKFENYMSNGFYSLSTPIWTNFGNNRGLPISCFSCYVPDTMEGILEKVAEVGIQSKVGGGTSGYFGDLRPRGAKISVGGESSGPVHFMELFDSVSNVVSQGCYDDETEVLTSKGWIFFKDLDKYLEIVNIAQVNDDETVSFVKANDYFEYDVSENLIWFKDSKNIDLLVTKNHNMVYKYEKKEILHGENGLKKYTRYVKDEFCSKQASECPLHRDVRYLHSGFLPLGKGMSDWERILIATQAEGSYVKNCQTAIKYRFSKERKSARLKWLLDSLNIEYSYSFYETDKTHNFYVNFGEKIPKTLDWVDLSNKSLQWCQEFLLEILEWDGSKVSEDGGTYSSTIKLNCDKVQEVCAVAGYKSHLSINNRENEPTKSPIYNLYFSTGNYFGVEKIEKQEVFYSGKVYCVEVPSHRLIVRRGGRTVVCGNSARRGSFAAYLPVEHPDILEFLQIRSEGHPIQNISIGVCITNRWMEEMISGDKEKRKIWGSIIKKRFESGYPYLFFTDNVNNNAPQVYKDKNLNIYGSQLCSEITLSTSPTESFVCDLSSMNAEKYDQWKTTDAVETLVEFLDANMTEFIEKTKHNKFMQPAREFAISQRALGVGLLGWHSLLQSKMIPFESMEAKILNNQIWKLIKEKADKATENLAKEYGEPPLLVGYGRRNVTTLAVAPTTSCTTPETKFFDANGDVIDYYSFTERGGLNLRDILSIDVDTECGKHISIYCYQIVTIRRDENIIKIMAMDIKEGDEIINIE